MMSDVRADVRATLPLTVEGVAVLAPFISLFGTGWSLGVNCDWKISVGDDIAVTSDSEEQKLASAVELLKGKPLIDVEVDDGLFDPTFHFGGGEKLIVTSDTDLDPWVLRADRLSHTLVGRGPEAHKEWLNQHQP